MKNKYTLSGLAACLAILGAGCSTAVSKSDNSSKVADATAGAAEIKPVQDARALAELKLMADTLAAAHSMSFDSASTSPLRGPNGQWVHVFKTAKVEMQRPGQLYVHTGGDAFHQKIYFDGKKFSVLAPEAKLYASKAMAGDIDSMLAGAGDRGGDVFSFGDVLLKDPYRAWTNGLEGAVYVGESNRGGLKLQHLAFTAKDMDWEVWVGSGDHLPHMVFVKYQGEDRMPSVMIEFSNWRTNTPLKSSKFAFQPPAGARKADFKAPAFQDAENSTIPNSKDKSRKRMGDNAYD